METKNAFGVPGLTFVWNGINRDPNIIYDNVIYSYADIEAGIASMVTDDYGDCTPEHFDEWCANNQNSIIGLMTDLEYAGVDYVINQSKE